MDIFCKFTEIRSDFQKFWAFLVDFLRFSGNFGLYRGFCPIFPDFWPFFTNPLRFAPIFKIFGHFWSIFSDFQAILAYIGVFALFFPNLALKISKKYFRDFFFVGFFGFKAEKSKILGQNFNFFGHPRHCLVFLT